MKRIAPHLTRGPDEPLNEQLRAFYDRLLRILRQPVLCDGEWQLLESAPAWEGNWTHDCFIAFGWQGAGAERLIVAVNYAANHSQCHIRLPFADLSGKQWRLRDQLTPGEFAWSGDDLSAKGLFLDMAPWQACVFSMTTEA